VGLDSLFVRQMFTKTTSIDSISISISYLFDTSVVDMFDTSNVDSIGLTFYSTVNDSIRLFTENLPDRERLMIVDSGYNVFSVEWFGKTKAREFKELRRISMSILQNTKNSITDVRLKVWFKK
jgi:hypothetical protein